MAEGGGVTDSLIIGRAVCLSLAAPPTAPWLRILGPSCSHILPAPPLVAVPLRPPLLTMSFFLPLRSTLNNNNISRILVTSFNHMPKIRTL